MIVTVYVSHFVPDVPAVDVSTVVIGVSVVEVVEGFSMKINNTYRL